MDLVPDSRTSAAGLYRRERASLTPPTTTVGGAETHLEEQPDARHVRGGRAGREEATGGMS